MKLARLSKIALISMLATAMTTEAFAVELAAANAVNVRTGPGTGFAVVDTLHPGEVVDASECQANGWCHIQHSGPDGWVSGRYLVQVGSNAGVNRGNSGASGSSASDAAAAAAFIAILGIGALAIGSAIASSNNNQPPPPNLNWHRCPPGTVWSHYYRACVIH